MKQKLFYGLGVLLLTVLVSLLVWQGSFSFGDFTPAGPQQVTIFWAVSTVVFLLTVLIGSGAVLAISPMVAGLSAVGGEIPLRTAVSILVAAFVYVALILVVLKVSASLTKGWRIGGAIPQAFRNDPALPAQAALAARTAAQGDGATNNFLSERVRTAVASLDNRVSAGRITQLSSPAAAAASQGHVEMRGMVTSPAAAKHASYFNHRTSRISSDIPRELIR